VYVFVLPNVIGFVPWAMPGAAEAKVATVNASAANSLMRVVFIMISLLLPFERRLGAASAGSAILASIA